MMSRNLTPSGVSPSASPLISSLNETMDVSGVRSSCDTMARNWSSPRRACAAARSARRVPAGLGPLQVQLMTFGHVPGQPDVAAMPVVDVHRPVVPFDGAAVRAAELFPGRRLPGPHHRHRPPGEPDPGRRTRARPGAAPRRRASQARRSSSPNMVPKLWLTLVTVPCSSVMSTPGIAEAIRQFSRSVSQASSACERWTR